MGIPKSNPYKARGKPCRSLSSWHHMISSRYGDSIRNKSGSTVCKEWHCYATYQAWFEKTMKDKGLKKEDHFQFQHLPEVSSELNAKSCTLVPHYSNTKLRTLLSPSGELVTDTQASFMKKLGSGVWYLFNGKQDNFKNWTIPNDKGERVVELKQEPIYKLADLTE